MEEEDWSVSGPITSCKMCDRLEGGGGREEGGDNFDR